MEFDVLPDLMGYFFKVPELVLYFKQLVGAI